jgi:uncharacterized protein GlcG (DUF336 family)
MTIDLATALRITAGALDHGSAHRLKPLTVVVLDPGGHLISAQRQDGSSNGRFAIAFAKAHGALSLGVGSRGLMARAEQQPYFIAAATSALGGNLVPVPGGVIVRDGLGTVVGAIGISGDTSDNDEAAAVAGCERAGLAAQID